MSFILDLFLAYSIKPDLYHRFRFQRTIVSTFMEWSNHIIRTENHILATVTLGPWWLIAVYTSLGVWQSFEGPLGYLAKLPLVIILTRLGLVSKQTTISYRDQHNLAYYINTKTWKCHYQNDLCVCSMIFFFVALCMAVVSVSEALTCYKCTYVDGQELTRCADPFDETGSIKEICDENSYACMKRKTFVNGQVFGKLFGKVSYKLYVF